MRTKPSSQSELPARKGGCTQLERHVPAYRQYLLDRGNAAGYVRSCEAAVMPLSMWMRQANRRLADIDETLVVEFLEGHLPHCTCATSACHPASVRAALAHLLVVLRDADAIGSKPQDETAVGEELRRYDQYMTQVRGLAPKTREGALRLVEALLRKHFGDGDIRFEVVTAEHVRRFFATQAKNYKTPSSLGAVVSALRGYFRWRATLGDRTHARVGALAYPANWQLASLPKSLEEVEQLKAALGQSGPSMLRADAMVRCALDLGLCSGEVARLSLDDLIASCGLRLSEALSLNLGDVDLRRGLLTIRRTKFAKSRQVPLHPSTAKALGQYRWTRDVAGASRDDDAPFFIGTRGRLFGKPISGHQVENVFATLRSELGWVNRGTHHAPRIHDLRHTFVVRCILLWQQQGIDVDEAMLSLSTYVGHAMVTNTYWYLQAVPELMAVAAQRFESCMPELSHA